ncbi:hypothetical protein Tco_0342886, partial [Tanacetum coccineum]
RIIHDNPPDVGETSGGNEVSENHGFLSHTLHVSIIQLQDEVSTLHEDKAEFPKSAVVDEDEIAASDIDDQSKDYCDDVMRFTKNTSLDSSLDR